MRERIAAYCSRTMFLAKRYALISWLLGIASMLLVACGDDKKKDEPSGPEVSAIKAIYIDVPLVYEYAGRTVGSKEVEVRAQVGGILLEKAYTEGQLVKQGDILFKIDPQSYEVKLVQAKASREDAKAKLSSAERDWKRTLSLYEKKVISDREHDTALSAFEQARAEVAEADGAVQTAQINLDYTTVRAPIGGFISQEAKSEGNLITPADQLLTRIVQFDPMYIVFAYTDSELLRQDELIKNQDQLRVKLKLGDGSYYSHEGKINFTDNIVDLKTSTVNARATIANQDAKLFPGQFVRVIVKGITRSNVIAIPDKAVMQGPQGTFVYAVDAESKASIKPIKLGLLTEKGRLVESGLQEDDTIIVEGMMKIRPNQLVQVVVPKTEVKDTDAKAKQ